MSKPDSNIHARAANNDGNLWEDRQIEAKLAIAYEQRTANLISYAQLVEPSPELTALVKQIKERLGL